MRLWNTAVRSCVLLVLSVLLGASVSNIDAQQIRPEGPRFLIASAGRRPTETEPSRVPFLGARVKLAVNGMSLTQVLAAIDRQTGVSFVYGPDIVRAGRLVSVRADDLTLAAVLTEILFGTGVDVLVSGRRQVTLVLRPGAGKAQAGSLVGRVTDSATGRGVGSAEVGLEGTRWRTMTDSTGRYRLADVETGTYTLTARRIGYAKFQQSVTVADGEQTVNVVLVPRATRLDELVSTATGRQRRRDIANDVTVLDVDSIMRTEPIRSVTDLLETRVPGMTVQRTSGAPGDPARIRLRGASSPRQSNDPIVVVDGVRVYAQQSAARSANLAGPENYAAPSPLDYIDPNSIETLEVLKGPSAATLYGQDAANGVIVITTKKGKAGPTRWTAMAEHGRTSMSRTNKYPEFLVRWGHGPLTDTRVYCPLFNEVDCQADSTAHGSSLLSDPAFNPIAQGHRSALTLSASGGTAALTYAVTGSFQDELGLMKLPSSAAADYEARVGTGVPAWMQRPQQFRQWGATSQLTARLGPTADVSLTTQVTRERQQRSSLEQQLDFLLTTYFEPTTGTYYRSQHRPIGGTFLGQGTGLMLDNYYERATAVATTLTNGVSLGWRPRTWLALTADAGLNLIQRGDETLRPHGASVADTGGKLNSGKGTSLVSTVNLRANTTAPLGRGFVFRFAAGANYAGTSTDDQTLQTKNLPRGQTLKGSTLVDADRALSDEATFGWYLEPSLGHQRFTVTTGLRLDGGSSYGGKVSLPALPKLGFTYLVSDEPWFPMKALFQSLRLRLAYGKASRQPGITDRLRVYGETKSIWADGGFGDAVLLQSLGNSVLRPERSTEVEGGLDADLLDNRLTLSVTGYRKTTDDALLAVPVAPSVYGELVTQLKNIGVIRNTGLELTADARLVRSGPLNWSTQVQLSRNRNLVVRLGPGVKAFYTTGTFQEGGIRVAPGYPLFGRWVTPTVAYADANGNGVLERGEVVLGDTAVYIGQTLPDYTAGLHTTVGLWQNALAVTAGFQYEDGLSQQNVGASRLAAFAPGNNDPTASLAEQVAVLGVTPNFFETQTISTLRFNSVALSYRVPTTLARRLGAQTLQLALQGSNLALWTGYRGLDPNVNRFATGNSLQGGAILPQPRTWQVRVSATY